MAEHVDNSDPKGESLMEKIADKVHGDDSSSSDSDTEKRKPEVKPEVEPVGSEPETLKNKVWRLFGREKPVHKVLGGGKRMVNFSVSLPT